MWDRVKALCFNSLTVAWSYAAGLVGSVLNNIDALADALGDPNLKDQVAQAFGTEPKILGRWMMLVAIVTFLARLRTARKPS